VATQESPHKNDHRPHHTYTDFKSQKVTSPVNLQWVDGEEDAKNEGIDIADIQLIDAKK
jgi:hypothetical protein